MDTLAPVTMKTTANCDK